MTGWSGTEVKTAVNTGVDDTVNDGVNDGVDVGSAIADAAARLAAAQADRITCAPVRDELPDGDVGAAYAVQALIVGARVAAGARRIGRKIGLTNPAVQAQLGVDQPDFGVLLDDMACADGAIVDIARLLQPKIEAELAFALAADLDQPNVTEADVAAATGHVCAALEIVDSRITGWDISIVDTVADNGSSALFVLGVDEIGLDQLDPSSVQMILRSGSAIVSTGSGRDCLGDPLTAVAWLANTAREQGAPLRSGDIVLSGALGPMVPVAAGSSFTAEITGVGRVRVAFSDDSATRSAAL